MQIHVFLTLIHVCLTLIDDHKKEHEKMLRNEPPADTDVCVSYTKLCVPNTY